MLHDYILKRIFTIFDSINFTKRTLKTLNSDTEKVKKHLEKQANKANDICKQVTKGKMPIGSFRKNNPEKVPADQEIKTICNWATAIQEKYGGRTTYSSLITFKTERCTVRANGASRSGLWPHSNKKTAGTVL